MRSAASTQADQSYAQLVQRSQRPSPHDSAKSLRQDRPSIELITSTYGDGKISEDTGKRIPLDVSEGDEVLYSKYGGAEIKVEGEDLLFLDHENVLIRHFGSLARSAT